MDIRLISIVFSLLYFLCCVLAAPVLESKEGKDGEGKAEEGKHNTEDEKKIQKEMDDLGLEYGRYLQQVVEALEEDKEFAKKLENVSQDEIKNGAIARELNFVSHNVRNRLDELKRIEIERLRHLAQKEHQLEVAREEAAAGGGGGGEDDEGRRWRTLGGGGRQGAQQAVIDASHVDHLNPHSFEAEDLQKLILTATKDLEELDAKRREDFKQYEMEKELRYRESLANMTSDERAETERRHDDMDKKHREHPRVHHPGSKKQLEQVWEEQDHMPREEFNPKIFFSMHDINGDGFLDQQEVEAILTLEIRKLYSEKNSEDDPNEMREEFHRMREHIYKEADVNRDGLISKKEFLEFTRRMEFERDEGWKGLDESRVYSNEDLNRYQQQRAQLQPQYEQYGAYQQFQPQYYPPGYHYPQPQHPQQHPQQQYIPQQQQQYYQQMPQQMAPQQHPNPQQMVPGGHPQQQQYPPMAGQHPNQGVPPPQHPQAMGGQQHQNPNLQLVGQQPMGAQHPMAGQQQQQQQQHPSEGAQYVPNPGLHASQGQPPAQGQGQGHNQQPKSH